MQNQVRIDVSGTQNPEALAAFVAQSLADALPNSGITVVSQDSDTQLRSSLESYSNESMQGQQFNQSQQNLQNLKGLETIDKVTIVTSSRANFQDPTSIQGGQLFDVKGRHQSDPKMTGQRDQSSYGSTTRNQ